MRLLSALLLAALAVTGCADDGGSPTDASGEVTDSAGAGNDEGSSSPSPDAEEAEDASDEPADASAGVGGTVAAVDDDFDPQRLEIAVGERVTWTNEGEAGHTVTFEDAGSEVLEPGAGYERTFDEPGEHEYVCRIHVGMEGTVVVG